MPLPRLNWKMLPTIALPIISQSKVEGVLDGIFNIFNSNTYHDGSPRITGSGVAWTFFRTSSADSGSVKGPTAVVYGFPATMSVMSQSVVFAGSRSFAPPSQTPYLHPYVSYRGTGEGSMAGITPAPHTASIYVTVQKQANPFQYVSWLSPSIFNSGSSGVNTVSSSGFIDFVNFVGRKSVNASVVGYNFATINAWESQEAILVTVTPTGSQNILLTRSSTERSPGSFIALVGAWLEPLEFISASTNNNYNFNSCEDDGRIYGVACTYCNDFTNFSSFRKDFFSDAFSSAFFQSSKAATSARADYGRQGIYIPGVNNCIFSTQLNKFEIGTFLTPNVTSYTGNVYAYPMYAGLTLASDWSTTSRMAVFGRYRDMYLYPPCIGNGEIYSGSNLLGYTVNVGYRSNGGGNVGNLFLRA